MVSRKDNTMRARSLFSFASAAYINTNNDNDLQVSMTCVLMFTASALWHSSHV